MAQSASSVQKGIWIASYPKSGNTWVRLFIHNLFGEISGNPPDAQDINCINRHTVWETNAAPGTVAATILCPYSSAWCLE